MPLAKEKKKKTIEDFRLSKEDTGSAEVQIALLTERINGLQEHFTANKVDHHSRYGLIKMVGRRKKLLKYLKDNTPERYKEVIARLNLRK